jgi:hypothetical protein
VHLFNFVATTKAHGDRVDWVNAALFAELLSRVEGDALESNLRAASERGLMRSEPHGSKPGYVIDREHAEVQMLLGHFERLNGDHPDEAAPAAREVTPAAREAEPAATLAASNGAAAADSAAPPAAPRRRTRRGSRGGRNRRGGRGRKRPASSGSGEAAD